MDFGTTAAIVLQLVFLEAILSIDNAAVLGAMVAHLPNDRPIEWPRALQSLGETLHGLLGDQRTAALRVGLLGAYLGRGLMLLLAEIVIRNAWLRILGALYLLRLAFDELGVAEPGEAEAHAHHMAARSFWNVVVTIELADLAFSLDNVVAAVALSDQFWVVALGVALGIVAMRFAAGWFSYWVQREPVLKPAAYILVLNIGVTLLLEEFFGFEQNDWVRFGTSIAIIVLSLAYAHLKPLQIFQPVLHWLAEGFGNFNELMDWALVPVNALLRGVWRLLRVLFGAAPPSAREK